MSKMSVRKTRKPVFYRNEKFVAGSGSVRRSGFDATDMTWSGGRSSLGNGSFSSGSYRYDDFFVRDSDAIVECSETETDEEAEWTNFESDSEEEDTWGQVPEVGIILKEKWNMTDGTSTWFEGVVVAVCRRYFSVQWDADGTKTKYHRRSWEVKLAQGGILLQGPMEFENGWRKKRRNV